MFETIQAKLVLGFNVLALIVVAAIYILNGAVIEAIYGSLSFLIFAVLGTLTVNCLVMGNCNTYSWILTAISILLAIMAMGGSALHLSF